MHREILTKEQDALLSVVKVFHKDFFLVGGTAIAFHIGHRRSIDFDLFSTKLFKNSELSRKIKKLTKIDKEIVKHSGEYTLLCSGVKFTFYHYHFDIQHIENFEHIISMPDLLTLGAMKAHALAGRAKWKDYVDLYFILTKFHSLSEVTNKARELFKGEFNEKLFRTQLGFFDDVNYVEKVEYLPGYEVDDEVVKEKLIEFSVE